MVEQLSFQIVGAVCATVPPIVLPRLLDALDGPHAFVLAAVAGLSVVCQWACLEYAWVLGVRAASNCRSAICGAVYRHGLYLATVRPQKYSAGALQNFMATDAGKF